MSPAAVSLLLGIVNTALPGVRAIVADIRAMFKRYPDLTPEQLVALILAITTASDAAFDELDAAIKADQAAHPPVPSGVV